MAELLLTGNTAVVSIHIQKCLLLVSSSRGDCRLQNETPLSKLTADILYLKLHFSFTCSYSQVKQLLWKMSQGQMEKLQRLGLRIRVTEGRLQAYTDGDRACAFLCTTDLITDLLKDDEGPG